mgnify:CR=1 FL=1
MTQGGTTIKPKPKAWMNIIKAAAFILIGALLFTWISYMMRPAGDERKNVVGFYAEPDDTLDIVALGTSTTVMYWMPLKVWNEYGITSYNFATNNTPPQVMKYYVTEMLKTQHPDLLLVDLRPFQYGPQLNTEERIVGLRYSSDSFNYSWNRHDMINNSLPEGENPWPYYFDIALYHNDAEGLPTPEQVQLSLNNSHNYMKGFLFKEEHSVVERVEVGEITEKLAIDGEMEALLEEFMDTCEQNGLDVLFFVPPYSMMPHEDDGDYDITDDQRMHNYMEDLVRARGFDYINCNNYYDEIGLDFEIDFYNRSHVNIFGAEKFTDFMTSYILQNHQFTDKRSDPAYARWNEDYAQYAPQAQDTKEVIQWIIENEDHVTENPDGSG